MRERKREREREKRETDRRERERRERENPFFHSLVVVKWSSDGFHCCGHNRIIVLSFSNA